ncbi:FKBP-type peptidyl-prolyl cis-trans isomerase [Candidatus Cardinium hertigii]|jgi:FKBP-type peptidyl-prolyl cis-trans isomerase|uniref:peptidylprolyl isomerase n=1 Tax=Candidatus Cardinium hertigii TaxID=247481 RepID=A0A3N2QCG3_9BACT|nr:FKBP-type peptidyl-prolyl cis-trans isomerase [Candidatus Cardinium hertigii]ROT47474.1 hypothetical protein EDM02_02360 [Candidatus Cardinium hertigii]
MKRKNITAFFLVLLTLVAGLVWYNHQFHRYLYPFITVPSGFSYKKMMVGNGKKVKDGDVVDMVLVMKLAYKKGEKAEEEHVPNAKKEERVLIDTLKEPQPFLLRYDDLTSTNKQLAEMLNIVEEKQRVIFKFSPQYYLKDAAADLDKILEFNDLKKDDELVMDVEIKKIMNQEEYDQLMTTKRAAQLEKDKQQLEKDKQQLEKDKQLITDYLAAHNIQASSTDSGLFYIVDQSSEDIPIVKGKCVKINYTGRLLDGSVFDTTNEEIAKSHNIYLPPKAYVPFEFQVGVNSVIPGWEEGLLLLKKNEKARFFIPSVLAYGEDVTSKRIPGNAVLLFEIEVVDVF